MGAKYRSCLAKYFHKPLTDLQVAAAIPVGVPGPAKLSDATPTNVVGAPLEGRVLIIDDVITAGTAIREIMSVINQSDAEAAGVVIGVDRQERGTGANSAIQEVEMDYSLQVFSIIDITDILTYLQSKSDSKELVLSIKSYREKYGVS